MNWNIDKADAVGTTAKPRAHVGNGDIDGLGNNIGSTDAARVTGEVIERKNTGDVLGGVRRKVDEIVTSAVTSASTAITAAVQRLGFALSAKTGALA